MTGAAWMAGLSLLVLTAWAATPSPLVAELESAANTYHEDPAHLDRLREGLERVGAGTPTVAGLIALARVEFLWGDVRASSREAKLAAYDRGRQAAKRAVDQSPKNALAHLWYGVTTARWGQTRGILQSLSLLSEVQEQIRIVLERTTRAAGGARREGAAQPGRLGGQGRQGSAGHPGRASRPLVSCATHAMAAGSGGVRWSLPRPGPAWSRARVDDGWGGESGAAAREGRRARRAGSSPNRW